MKEIIKIFLFITAFMFLFTMWNCSGGSDGGVDIDEGNDSVEDNDVDIESYTLAYTDGFLTCAADWVGSNGECDGGDT